MKKQGLLEKTQGRCHESFAKLDASLEGEDDSAWRLEDPKVNGKGKIDGSTLNAPVDFCFANSAQYKFQHNPHFLFMYLFIH